MSSAEHEGMRGQATRIAVWASILSVILGSWAGTAALFLRWFR